MQTNSNVSTTTRADRAAELRKQRLMREALGEQADPTAPIHASFVFSLVLSALVGATSLTDDSGMGPGYAKIAKAQATMSAASPSQTYRW